VQKIDSNASFFIQPRGRLVTTHHYNTKGQHEGAARAHLRSARFRAVGGGMGGLGGLLGGLGGGGKMPKLPPGMKFPKF
jgi:hypothetical protein